jgi:hypothetical protein
MIAIRTPDQRLRIFVSSTMKELASARAAARAAIERLRLTPVLFELGARRYPPRDLYLAYLRQSDVFIGIYGQQYGWIAPDQKISGLEDEYLNAGGMPKLVYVQSPSPDRDPRLSEMLSRIQSDGLSYRSFATSDELGTLIADDLAVLLSERFDVEEAPPKAGRPELVEGRPLPSPASRFIGREREKSLVQDLLTGGEARLVTPVGAGGIGKTRLALEVGSGLIGKFDGVVMVPLEDVSSADLVVSSIASALGIPESPGQSQLDLIINYLRSRRMLPDHRQLRACGDRRRRAGTDHHPHGPGGAARHQPGAAASLRGTCSRSSIAASPRRRRQRRGVAALRRRRTVHRSHPSHR